MKTQTRELKALMKSAMAGYGKTSARVEEGPATHLTAAEKMMLRLKGSRHSPLRQLIIQSKIRDSIRRKRIRDEVRRALKRGSVGKGLKSEIDDPNFSQETIDQLCDEKINSELAREGLYKEESSEVLFSQLSDGNSAEWLLERDELNVNVLGAGTYLGENDFTDGDRMGGIAGELPRVATSDIWDLMRPAPKSLLHKIARSLADTSFIPHEEREIYASFALFSRNVETLEHFEDIMRGGLINHAPSLTFEKYISVIPQLKSTLRAYSRRYFRGAHPVAVAARTVGAEPSQIWIRFDNVWKSLTPKQRKAMSLLLMQETKPTYQEVAKHLKISIDSLKDRISGAVKKFTNEFAEFKSRLVVEHKATTPQKRPSRSPLYHVDEKSGLKTEISMRALSKKDHSARRVAEIKAWALASSLVTKERLGLMGKHR